MSNAVQLLRNYGSKVKYQHDIKGHNSRLDPIQAIFLSNKLKNIENEIQIRKQQMLKYKSELPHNLVRMVHNYDFIDVSWHLAVGVFAERDQLQHFLNQADIETVIHYPIPIHSQAAYLDTEMENDMHLTEINSNKLLSLPLGSHLNSGDIDYVIAKINQFYNK